ALERAPHDAGLRTALERLRASRPPEPTSNGAHPAPLAARSTYAFPEPLGELLIDDAGLVLAGELRDQGGVDVSASVGAELSGVRAEAARALTRLGLGAWRALTIDAAQATIGLAPAPNDSLSLVAAEPHTAAGLFRRYVHRARQRAVAFFEESA
ncbi:MAG: hypothetical protein ACREOG_01065, partial [Gemmatimonadaceae bacterium]